MEKAREAAARAIHDRYEQLIHWAKTLGKAPHTMETSGIKEFHRLDANAAIDAFLSAAREDGWKLVRREASEEMVTAGGSSNDVDGLRVGEPQAIDVWSAMWDAAPEVKP